jgi:dipeptidyl aminopeptidase/acylaminoacyl peptidase
MQLFTALQRQGIPSKFLYFPDEGHWVQKPQNLRLWFNTMYDWKERYLLR